MQLEISAKRRIRYTPPASDRFWPRVNKEGPVPSRFPELGSCWVWTHRLDPVTGYGRFYFKRPGAQKGRDDIAHRVAYVLTHGPITGDLDVCHLCDNRVCVRPSHLVLETSAYNNRDTSRKGRFPLGADWAACRLPRQIVRPIVPPMPLTVEQRFWSKVDKDGACWRWLGGTSNGYGSFSFNGGHVGAHVFSWRLHCGAIPKGLFVCHNCPTGDDRSCVNPAHLFLGTRYENTLDAKAKGRLASGERHASRTHPEKLRRGDNHPHRMHPERLPRGDTHWTKLKPQLILRGERNGQSKLSEADVRTIRAEYTGAYGQQTALARRYGVTQPLIGQIVRGTAWKYLA